MATLVIVRHGEAEGNQSHRFIGHQQVRLTATGHDQARAVADRLSSLPVTRILSSDLVRCVETVTPLSDRVGVAVEQDGRWREVDNGEWTGLLPQEIEERWPDLWKEYAGGGDVQRPGGESWTDVAGRVLPAAEDLLVDEGVTVIGTHSGPALILALWASGVTQGGNVFRGPFGAPHNGSVSVVGSGPRLLAYNDVGHVASLPDQRLPFTPVSHP